MNPTRHNNRELENLTRQLAAVLDQNESRMARMENRYQYLLL